MPYLKIKHKITLWHDGTKKDDTHVTVMTKQKTGLSKPPLRIIALDLATNEHVVQFKGF